METFYFDVEHTSGQFYLAVEAVDVKAAKNRADYWFDRNELDVTEVQRVTHETASQFGGPVLVF